MEKYRLIYKRTNLNITKSVPYIVAAALSFALPSIGAAQQENEVTLRFASGQDSISGTLNDFEDGKFFLQSTIGLVVIPFDGVVCIGDACPEETRIQLDNAQVTLTAKDGSVTITGDLIEIDGTDYVIASSVGEQRVPTSLVNCEGEGCVVTDDVPAPDVPVIDEPVINEPVIDDPVSDEVTLSNGTTTISGKLLGYEDGDFLIEDPNFGEIRVSDNDFDCTGTACP